MDWQGLLEAVVLGVVQGLTEFLPISSTAHLRIVPQLLWGREPGAAYSAVIQLGTLVAVFLYFRHDIARIALGFFRDLYRREPLASLEARQGWMMILATVPIVVFGLAFKRYIKEDLRGLYVIAGALIALALILWLAEWLAARRQRLVAAGRAEPARGLNELGFWDALVVGLAQAVALVPGSSRSGVTITAGLFLNMDRETAARFSFLLSLPAILAAGVYSLIDEREVLLGSADQMLNLVVGTVVSGVVGYASIAGLLRYLRTRSTAVFIVYRLALGILLLILLWRGVLSASVSG